MDFHLKGSSLNLDTDPAGNPHLSQLSEEGFVDCVFRIADIHSDSQTHTLQLRACHEGAVVGVTAVVVRGIQGAFDEEMELIAEHVYRPAVSLLRAGSESDRLFNCLAALYGLQGGDRRMIEQGLFTGIALHQPPVDMDKEAVRLKLFGHDSEGDRTEDYHESFFNIDLPNGLVFWNEKDPDYREALLRDLSFRMETTMPGGRQG